MVAVIHSETNYAIRAKRPYAIGQNGPLFPPDIYRQAPIAGVVWAAPAVHIEDAPRFSWRGAHLDVSRHFMPKEFVKKFIDLLARGFAPLGRLRSWGVSSDMILMSVISSYHIRLYRIKLLYI